MMKKILYGLFGWFSCVGMWAQGPRLSVTIENTLPVMRKAYPVTINLADHAPNRKITSAQVFVSEKEIPSQLDDLNGDMQADELVFLTDIPSKGKVNVQINLSGEKPQKDYPSGVNAYIKLNDIKEKHPKVKSVTYPGDANLLDMYNSIYGHGAVFESSLAGFRIYMDNRQSIDLYGKTLPRLELEETGFYTTEAQAAEGYGCDILWAGQSVGAGSFRGYRNEQPCYIDTVSWRRQTVIASGPIRSIVEVSDGSWIYKGQTLDMTQRYTLYAGHRDVAVDVHIQGAARGETFCTGVQKLEDKNEGFMSHNGLTGSWGNNIPEKSRMSHNEWVGLGLYAHPENRKAMKEDAFNYLTLLQLNDAQRIRYHVAVCARRENDGFKSSREWFDYLKKWQEGLSTPCLITVQ